MSYIVKRNVLSFDSNDNEFIISTAQYRYHDLKTAIQEIELFYKADKAMYRLLTGKNNCNICDDWHDDISYYFRIDDVGISAELVNAEQIALDTFGIKK